MAAQVSSTEATPSVKQIKSIFSVVMDMPPCCLDFCPDAPEYFAVGTYKLVEVEQPKSSNDASSKDHPETAVQDKSKDGAETETSREDESEAKTTIPSPDKNQDKEEPAAEPAPTPSSQKRVGCLYLYRLLNRDGDFSFKPEQTIPFDSGILDLGFSNLTPKILALATSNGSLHLYRLNSFDGQLIPLSILPVFKPTVLILSLSWVYPSTTSHGDSGCPRDCLATSNSNGCITLHYFRRPDYKYLPLARDTLPSQATHSDQAWCVAWTVDYSNNDRPILLSGGDDASLHRHNFLRCVYTKGEPFAKYLGTETDRRTHMAGVTGLMPFPYYKDEQRVLTLTGSYDDHVRIYNLSDKKRPVLHELNLGGGAWKFRLLRDITQEAKRKRDHERKIENEKAPQTELPYRPRNPPGTTSPLDPMLRTPSNRPLHAQHLPLEKEVQLHFQVIASCMYAGIRVLDIKRDGEKNWSVEVVGKFEEGESMAYAGAAAPIFDEEGQRPKGRIVCASTSFYDRRVFVWRWK